VEQRVITARVDTPRRVRGAHDRARRAVCSADHTWTIAHIGVVPTHRGHGHVSELLAAADRAARESGFSTGLSDVDVDNAPMVSAMERAGHRSDLRPWHIWHYRRHVG
jgi:ribosomal protein S18 acetylase RimI-like enzyme